MSPGRTGRVWVNSSSYPTELGLKKQNPLTIHTNGRIGSVTVRWSGIPRFERQKNQPKNKNQISANIITRFEQIPKIAKKQFQIFTKSKPQIPKYKQIPKQQKKFQIKTYQKAKKYEQKSQQQISKSIRVSQTLDLREFRRRWHRNVRSDLSFKTHPKTPHELRSPPLASGSCHRPQPWRSDLHLRLLVPNGHHGWGVLVFCSQIQRLPRREKMKRQKEKKVRLMTLWRSEVRDCESVSWVKSWKKMEKVRKWNERKEKVGKVTSGVGSLLVFLNVYN